MGLFSKKSSESKIPAVQLPGGSGAAPPPTGSAKGYSYNNTPPSNDSGAYQARYNPPPPQGYRGPNQPQQPQGPTAGYQPQQQYGGGRGAGGYQGGPPPQGQYQQQGGNNGYGAYPSNGYGGGGQPVYQESNRFGNVRAPSSKLGSGYDEMMQQQQYGGRKATTTRGGGAGGEDLEAEYGANGGGGGGSGGQDQGEEEVDEEEEEVEAIKQQMRFTKQESLSSTMNALRLAREAEETATNSMMRLGDQSEKLANTERNLDLSKAHSSRADDNAREIVALNRSIFRPNLTMDKKGKRDAAEARIINRHIEEREERERIRAEALAARNRVDQTLGAPGSSASNSPWNRFGSDRFGGGKKGPAQMTEEEKRKNKLQERSRYQFEATGSDDELEDELDSNLDEIGRISGRLNMLGRAMGSEIDEQNARIKRLDEKTSNLDTRIYSSTQRLGNIK